MFREKVLQPVSGVPALVGLLLGLFLTVVAFVGAAAADAPLLILPCMFVFAVLVISLRGITVVQPNNGQVVTLFGRYVGTISEPGMWWVNPFTARNAISLRVRNMETTKLKVNDANSNPIEIAAVVVWKVTDTAEACFEVDNYERYVSVQSESALRALASGYPYDAHNSGAIALSTHTHEVSEGLMAALRDRLAKAGVAVVEARISHLAYAPEIAAAMLQRQQASAVVAARYTIVEGAVGMVENALELLGQKKIVELDDERKAAMVSNLLVVLCSDRAATPVVNTGTLYS